MSSEEGARPLDKAVSEGFMEEVKTELNLENGREFESENMCEEETPGMPEKGIEEGKHKQCRKGMGG